jgi:hypothetical protein
MSLSLPELRVVGLFWFTVAGLATVVGAVVASLLAAAVVRAGLSVGGWLTAAWAHASAVEGRGEKAAKAAPRHSSFPLDAADHALLARQAWWRLRC